MDLHELPFAKIIILREDIAEVVVDEGVELNLEMVNQYHDFLLSHLGPPFSLLINKLNSYTYTFDAQINLANLKEINSMAVVAYNWVTRASTAALANSVPREKDWNIELFSNREEAWEWLLSEQESVATNSSHSCSR